MRIFAIASLKILSLHLIVAIIYLVTMSYTSYSHGGLESFSDFFELIAKLPEYYRVGAIKSPYALQYIVNIPLKDIDILILRPIAWAALFGVILILFFIFMFFLLEKKGILGTAILISVCLNIFILEAYFLNVGKPIPEIEEPYHSKTLKKIEQ